MKIAFLVAMLLLVAASASGQVVQTKSLISAGGTHSASGTMTMSSNLGDVITGPSADGATEVWSGFWAPDPLSIVGVETPVLAVRNFIGWPTPNPARNTVQIEFGTRQPGTTEATVYDVQGRRVVQLGAPNAPGVYQLHWDLRDAVGRAVANGLYFLRLATPGQTQTRRLIIIR